jgi:hypothetical protein
VIGTGEPCREPRTPKQGEHIDGWERRDTLDRRILEPHSAAIGCECLGGGVGVVKPVNEAPAEPLELATIEGNSPLLPRMVINDHPARRVLAGCADSHWSSRCWNDMSRRPGAEGGCPRPVDAFERFGGCGA